MKCVLCGKEITDYDPEFNHLKVDETREVDICRGCLDKIGKWQGKIMAKLFPTKAMKRRFKNQ